jgi:predicted Fe-S protein YdhL (DUF1289 family)
MSVVADSLSTRVRVSDPKPAFCVGCWQGAQENVRFVDFDAAFDGGQLVEERDGVVMTRIPGDDLHLCEGCVRAAAQALGLKPDLHARQVRTIKHLELQVEHFKDENRRLRDVIGKGGPDVRRAN